MADRGCNYNNTRNFTPYTDSEKQARFYSYLVLTILSTLANILVVITFIVEKSLRTTFNIFIFNLAIVDLLTSIFRMGYKTLMMVIVEGSSWPYGQAMCDFNGILRSIVYVANVYILVAIAICRFIVIVLSKRHLITKNVVHTIMIIIWFISLMVSLFPVFGWNRYCYQASQFACSLDPVFEIGFPTYIVIAEFFIPMIILIVCYIGILTYLRKNSYRMHRISCVESDIGNTMQQITQRESKATIGMFILFIAFVVCLGPYSICIFILGGFFQIRVSSNVVFFCGFMVDVNSLCNPIIYAVWQKPFRMAYYRILRVFCCYPKVVHQ